MERQFPHLPGATPFPHGSGVDPYAIEVEFDYSRWAVDSSIKFMRVGWDSTYANVVGWESEEQRDRYFEEQPGVVDLLTANHQVIEGKVKLPIPIQTARSYNYLMLTLPEPTSTGQPLDYSELPRRKFFYFVTGTRQLAPSTTECTIELDVWTTYINSIDVTFMQLARGHAPMAWADANDFLSAPTASARYCAVADEVFGEGSFARSTHGCVLNDENWVCFATYSDLQYGAFGTKEAGNWRTPGVAFSLQDGAPAPLIFCSPTNEIWSLLTWIVNNRPQWYETVIAAFIMPKKLVHVTSSFLIGGYSVGRIEAIQADLPLLTLSKEAFGFPAEIANQAKLYTYPYSRIHITDGRGNGFDVHVEDMATDQLTFNAFANIVWPSIKVNGYIGGLGEGGGSFDFANIDARSADLYGNWAQAILDLNIPLFAMSQEAQTANDWGDFYGRAQAKVEYDTAYTNADNTASNITGNNAVTVAANTANTSTNMSANSDCTSHNNDKISQDVTQDNNMSSASYRADMAGLAVAGSNNVANTVASSIGSLLSLNLGGIATSIVSGVTSNASIAVSQSNSTDIYTNTIAAASYKRGNATRCSTANTSTTNGALSDVNSTNNNAATSIASNNAGLIRANAGNDKAAAISRVNNGILAASISAPKQYGQASGSSQATRPLGAFAQVVTQPPAAIAAAGAYFARWGYAFGQQWVWDSWNMMENFTYWQASEIWLDGAQDVDFGVIDKVRSMVADGVTVWRDPNRIGKVSIYDN